MIVVIESVVNTNRIYNQCNRNKFSDSSTGSKIAYNMEQNALPIVRSVAMSENIARSVREEVKHLIHVNNVGQLPMDGLVEDPERDKTSPVCKSEYHVHGTSSSVSYILPSVEDSVISAFVLSKWDDIMGPQTVHVWLRDQAKTTPCLSTSPKSACLATAVKYVTSHTVNYTGACVSVVPSSREPVERSCSIFIVPELDLIAQSFVLKLRDSELSVPYSLAVVVSYRHYAYFLHLHQLCQHWLQRMAACLRLTLLKCSAANSAFETSEEINRWMVDTCDMMISLKTYGLAAHQHSYHQGLLSHPLLERILTSHLQTFGCTVVMGTSSEEINSLISFLALFLDTDELYCSRFVLPPGNCSFHAGLFLQGLLLNEFGCRELCSVELAANPYPVTAVDLTRGGQSSAVRQTPLHHIHPSNCNQEKTEPALQLHETVLHPVKEDASLVCCLLEDLRKLPPPLWTDYIGMFRRKLNSLALSLLNLACWMRTDREKAPFSKYLAQVLDLSEADLLIVLAIAEKLQPGIYSCVMASR